MNQHSPPYHKSERMFRRYEEHIQKVVFDYPKACNFDPSPLSIETFKCRFRDAAASLIEYNWTTSIDISRLVEIRKTWAVGESAGLVIVCPENQLQELKKAGRAVEGNPQGRDKFAFMLDAPEPPVLLATVILLDQKLLKNPVHVKNINRETLQKLSEKYDIGVSDDATGFIIL